MTKEQLLSELDTARQRITQLERRFNVLTDELADVILIVRLPERVIEYTNSAVRDVFGYEPEECIEKSAEMLYASRDGYVKYGEMIRECINSGRTTMRVEVLQKRKNGELFLSDASSRFLFADGVLTRAITIVRDITSHKQIQEALEQSENNFRNSLENSPLGIIVIGERAEPPHNNRGEIYYANKAVLNIYGLSSVEELKATPIEERVSPDSLDVLIDRLALRESGKPVPKDFEIDAINKSGQVRHLEVKTDTVIWDGVIRNIQFYNDVTERKQMEEQLRHVQVLASLGEMTAGIAHEVGNPLASIMLYSEVAMKGDGLSRQMKKDLKVIHDEAKRAGGLMKDLLAYGRKLTPKVHRIDINSVLEKVIDLRQYQEKVHNITVARELAEGPLFVRGDQAQLTQVFLNLVLNAEEAVNQLGGGNIKFTSKVNKDWIKISVSDDGPGIPKENLNQIFMPFFTTKKVGEGTGLGLSICYGIVTSHSGLIKVKNNPTHGATFTVELPLLAGQQGALPI